MKKIILLAIIGGVIALGVLTGCNPKNEPSNKEMREIAYNDIKFSIMNYEMGREFSGRRATRTERLLSEITIKNITIENRYQKERNGQIIYGFDAKLTIGSNNEVHAIINFELVKGKNDSWVFYQKKKNNIY